MQVTTIGLDIAKRVFRVHGLIPRARLSFAGKLKRAELLHFFSQLASCLVGIEACVCFGVEVCPLRIRGFERVIMPVGLGTPCRFILKSVWG